MLPPPTRRRAKPVTCEAFFPGYLFARMDVTSGAWLAARSAPGILYFLGGEEAPTPIPDVLVDEISQRAAAGPSSRQEPQFVPGQPVVKKKKR